MGVGLSSPHTRPFLFLKCHIPPVRWCREIHTIRIDSVITHSSQRQPVTGFTSWKRMRYLRITDADYPANLLAPAACGFGSFTNDCRLMIPGTNSTSCNQNSSSQERRGRRCRSSLMPCSTFWCMNRPSSSIAPSRVVIQTFFPVSSAGRTIVPLNECHTPILVATGTEQS